MSLSIAPGAISHANADIERLDQNHRRSRAVVAGGVVYLAGQVADGKAGDIAAQTREALAKVDDLLAQAGTDKSRALTAQIWLASMQDYDGFNTVWDAWVVPGHTPTRCCGKVELADPAYRVEIVVTALLP
ncbi:RidA family protein [Cupriavidus sp. 30B13]|uniref:RidA family protein n=1 Tax=Cupriavidus sp. 30B13 TaxID=3384241 RepID=UPI003B90A3C0